MEDTSPDSFNRFGISNADAHYLTMRRKRLLELHSKVNKVVLMWECSWQKRVRTDPAVQEFLKSNPLTTEILTSLPLSDREGLRGGMTECFGVWADSEKIAKALSAKLGREIAPQHGTLIGKA